MPPPPTEPGPTERADKRERTQAFETHVLPQLDVMHRVARSLTPTSADAEDLVQETLLRAFRGINGFDGRYPRAWLLTIMRNTNINHARKKRPELSDDPDMSDHSDRFAHSNTPEAALVAATFDATIDLAFAALSPDFRQIVELVDIHGLAYQEAAEVLDVPIGTVMSRLHRARKRIRETVAETGLESARVER